VEITGGGEGETASVSVNDDGTVTVIVGTSPHGQGHETTFADIVMDVLGIDRSQIEVLHGVNLKVEKGEIIALLGANGAGKSTTIKAIMGLVKPSAGRILLDGRDLSGQAAHLAARAGIALVPEGRKIFKKMTVEENLQVGGVVRSSAEVREQLADVYALFPRLGERRRQIGGTLSGGEQQMLAIARALMGRPRLLLLDEPSLGLAPMLVEEIFGIVQQLNRQEKLTVLLVEQNAALALTIAEHGYVMENGRIVLDGTAAMLTQNADIKEFYLGLTEVGSRRSYRDVKHYKRRKRWLS